VYADRRDVTLFTRQRGRLPEQRPTDHLDYRGLLHRDGSVLTALPSKFLSELSSMGSFGAETLYRLEIAVYLVSRRGLLMTAGTFLTGTVRSGVSCFPPPPEARSHSKTSRPPTRCSFARLRRPTTRPHAPHSRPSHRRGRTAWCPRRRLQRRPFPERSRWCRYVEIISPRFISPRCRSRRDRQLPSHLGEV
jgi:hypothetical protein